MRAAVIPSQKLKSTYKTAVAIHKTSGHIFCGFCTCIAGMSSSCNHVAALLFKLDDHSDVVTQGNRGPSSTSLPDTWNVPRPMKLPPTRVKELEVVKPKLVQSNVTPAKRTYEPVDQTAGYVSMKRVMQLQSDLTSRMGESLGFHQVWPSIPDVRQESLLVHQFTRWHRDRGHDVGNVPPNLYSVYGREQ